MDKNYWFHWMCTIFIMHMPNCIMGATPTTIWLWLQCFSNTIFSFYFNLQNFNSKYAGGCLVYFPSRDVKQGTLISPCGDNFDTISIHFLRISIPLRLKPLSWLTRVLQWVLMFYWISCGKEIKCEACRAFYLFHNEFNKFNNTIAQMLDSIYHMTSR